MFAVKYLKVYTYKSSWILILNIIDKGFIPAFDVTDFFNIYKMPHASKLILQAFKLYLTCNERIAMVVRRLDNTIH